MFGERRNVCSWALSVHLVALHQIGRYRSEAEVDRTPNPAYSVENGDTQPGTGSRKAVVPTGSPLRSTLHLRRFGALEQSSAKFLMRGRTIF